MDQAGNIKNGTIGSILLVLLFSIDTEELLSTIILAAIGAIVSFMISVLLERVFRKKKKD
jgi:mannitol-specific phosphotransferase system IIBC component